MEIPKAQVSQRRGTSWFGPRSGGVRARGSRPLPWSAVLLCVATGCERGPAPMTTVVDSAGVRITMTRDSQVTPAQVDVMPALSLGGPGAFGPTQFFRVQNVLAKRAACSASVRCLRRRSDPRSAATDPTCRLQRGGAAHPRLNPACPRRFRQAHPHHGGCRIGAVLALDRAGSSTGGIHKRSRRRCSGR